MLAGEQITLERTRVPLIYFTLTTADGNQLCQKSQTKTALLPQMMLDEMLRAKMLSGSFRGSTVTRHR